jgi:hypothetical protein
VLTTRFPAVPGTAAETRFPGFHCFPKQETGSFLRRLFRTIDAKPPHLKGPKIMHTHFIIVVLSTVLG